MLFAIPTIVMSQLISHIGINDDELLSATLRQLDGLFPELIEDVHNAGHRLGMRAFPLTGGDDLLDRPAVDDEPCSARARTRAPDENGELDEAQPAQRTKRASRNVSAWSTSLPSHSYRKQRHEHPFSAERSRTVGYAWQRTDPCAVRVRGRTRYERIRNVVPPQ